MLPNCKTKLYENNEFEMNKSKMLKFFGTYIFVTYKTVLSALQFTVGGFCFACLFSLSLSVRTYEEIFIKL